MLEVAVLQLAGINKAEAKSLHYVKGILKISLGSITAMEWGWCVAPKNVVFL